MALSVPSLRSPHDGVAYCFAYLALHTARPYGAVGPSLFSSHGGVAHCFASLALQPAYACGAVGPFASLVTRRRRSLLRISFIASGVCLWCRRALRFARHKTASLIASLLLRCNRRVPVAPSVPSFRSSHDGVAHCVVSLALQVACACGAVGPFASLVTRRRRSLRRFSCLASGVCPWRCQSLRFARHMTASLIALLLSRCIPRVLEAPSVPRCSRHMTASLIASLLLRGKRRVPVASSVVALLVT